MEKRVMYMRKTFLNMEFTLKRLGSYLSVYMSSIFVQSSV